MNKRPSHPPTRGRRPDRGGSAASKSSAKSSASGKSSVQDHTSRPPRQLSARAIVLAFAVLMAFIIITPTLRSYLSQAEQKRELAQELETTQSRVAALEQAKIQWQDPDFVKAQARQRLNYIMPGETAYRVLDPETITGEISDSEFAEDPADPGVVSVLAQGPWYVAIWESVHIAGVAAHE